MTRVYLATTRAGLARLRDHGSLPPDTERVEAPDDAEESEYAALMTAATLSAGLGSPDGRRVVVVAELPRADDRVTGADVVAVHADTEDRPPGAHPDDDLAWFATQEIEQVLAG